MCNVIQGACERKVDESLEDALTGGDVHVLQNML